MLTTFLLTVACCCGCPLYFGKPAWDQYPATASLPAEVADLRLRDADDSVREMEAEISRANWLTEETFSGRYTDQAGKQVTVIGGTGFRPTPESDAEGELGRLTERYALTDVTPVDSAIRGRHVRCGTGRSGETSVVVCTSVDHGSLITGVFTRLSLPDSASLLGTLRSRIITVERT
ncbi:hypothetical protein ABT336_26260 [Micromonospora sp. NPDC000207]|uniref:hypothetical protein n=1 Tax=Micromonospora sp. NPDC000207 TaxID=3154246 RepID=UPI003332C29B